MLVGNFIDMLDELESFKTEVYEEINGYYLFSKVEDDSFKVLVEYQFEDYNYNDDNEDNESCCIIVINEGTPIILLETEEDDYIIDDCRLKDIKKLLDI